MLGLDVRGRPRALGAQTPRRVGWLVLGAVVDGVNPDAVGVDVEPVAGCKLTDGLARRAHVLAADRDEALRAFVPGVVLRVRTPERHLERDGVVEQRVVRGQAEPLQLVQRVLPARVRQPPREVAQLGHDPPEVLLVLGAEWASAFEFRFPLTQAVALVGKRLDLLTPAVDHPLDVRGHVRGRPLGESRCHRRVEVRPKEANERSHQLGRGAGVENHT